MLTFRLSVGLTALVGLLVIPGSIHSARRALPFTGIVAARMLSTEAEAALEDRVVIEDREIREIIAQPTVHRQIPRIRFFGNRRTYEFLAAHPPLSSQIAKRLSPQLEGYTIRRVGPGVYTIDDRGALRGEARLIAATDDQHIYRFQGEVRSLARLLHFSGRMVVIFRYREIREGDRTYIDTEPGFYLRIDHLVIHTLTKLLSPVIRSMVDRRVKMIVDATHQVFDRIHTDPEALYRQMSTWPEVQPLDLEAFRQAFLGKEAMAR